MGGKELGADAATAVTQEIEAVNGTTMPASVAAREEGESRGAARESRWSSARASEVSS